MIAQREQIEVLLDGDVACYFDIADLSPKDKKEVAAYDRTKDQRTERHGVELFDDLVFKAPFIKTFKMLIPALDLSGGERILEMGSGQAWASVLLKSMYPTCYVAANDLAPSALAFCTHYEELLDVKLDEKWAFNCRDIPFADAQFDRIFTMASFHHFGDGNDFRGVLREMRRVLRPGGKIVLLYEPSVPAFMYPLAFRAVNARRAKDGVDEDVLVVSKMKREAGEVGLDLGATYFPEWRCRDGVKSLLYYFLLTKVPPLQALSMCTVNITLTKVG
jgi:SAM-dependent methyltransferase